MRLSCIRNSTNKFFCMKQKCFVKYSMLMYENIKMIKCFLEDISIFCVFFFARNKSEKM